MTKSALLSIRGSKPQTHWDAGRWTQHFIHLRSIKGVKETPGDLSVKNRVSLCKGSLALRHLNPICISLSTVNEMNNKKKAK